MKPFPTQDLPIDERTFNYRLSRARRVIENAFGIAATRFRIFRRPIIANVENVKVITEAVVALHNFLMSHNSSNVHRYCPINYTDQERETRLHLENGGIKRMTCWDYNHWVKLVPIITLWMLH